MYFDHVLSSLNSSQIFPSSLPTQLHFLSLPLSHLSKLQKENQTKPK